MSDEEQKKDEIEGIVGQSNSPDGFTLVVKGSARYCCHICHQDAWISPGGQRTIKRKPTIKVTCLDCVRSGRLRDKMGEEVTMHLPDRADLVADLGEEAAEMILKAYGKRAGKLGPRL